MVKALAALFRVLGLVLSTHVSPHDSVTPNSGDPIPSSGLSGHRANMWYIDIHTGKIHMHINS